MSATAAPVPTFTKDVAPILFKNCAKCHRPGEIASSVALLSYDTARPWARAIKQKVLQREMPPWPADPEASLKFRNDARLAQNDINTLVAWVDGGSPKGIDSDLPPVPPFARDRVAREPSWLHPQGLAPDLVVSLPGEVVAPATGVIPYVRYLANLPFAEDKWVVAIQARPGNPALVHHMAITELTLNDGMTPADVDKFALIARQLGIRDSATGTRPSVATPGNSSLVDLLGVYTPGSTFESYEEGSAKLLKGGKNQYINFNIHYQTTGKPEKDRSMIAFWFQPQPPKHQMFRVSASGETIIANGKELLTDAPGKKAEGTRVAIPPIPPHAENYELIGITGYPESVTIYQFQPHAHLRGKDFTYTVVYPDGRRQTVLTVPKYNFNWQLAYDLEKPLRLPAGSVLAVTAHYDNSSKNKYNPAPDKEVYFNDENQSWDEMFTPFIQYTFDSQNQQLSSSSGIAEVIGCLEQGPPGSWTLAKASDPTQSRTQTASAATLKASAAKPLGTRRFQLFGVGVFDPLAHKEQKISVRGVLIQDTGHSRINVTSLQTLASACSD